MDLHYSQTGLCPVTHIFSLNPLWIYTTLKPKLKNDDGLDSLNPLWIYTTLKLVERSPKDEVV